MRTTYSLAAIWRRKLSVYLVKGKRGGERVGGVRTVSYTNNFSRKYRNCVVRSRDVEIGRTQLLTRNLFPSHEILYTPSRFHLESNSPPYPLCKAKKSNRKHSTFWRIPSWEILLVNSTITPPPLTPFSSWRSQQVRSSQRDFSGRTLHKERVKILLRLPWISSSRAKLSILLLLLRAKAAASKH